MPKPQSGQASTLTDTIFRGLFEASADAIFIVARSGEILEANPRARSIFNLTELGSEPFFVQKLMPAIQVFERLNDLFEQYSQGKNLNVLNDEEFVYHQANERTLYLEINTGFLGQGEDTLLYVTAKDITSRHILQEEKDLVQSILDEALETIPDAFVVYDDKDRLVLCNSSYKKIYKTSAPALTEGNSFEEIIRFGVERGQYPQAGKTLKEQEIWIKSRMQAHLNPTGAILQKTDDGRWLKIDERKTQNNFIVGIRTDVTQIKDAEERVRSQKAVLEEQAKTLQEMAIENLRARQSAEQATEAKSNFLAIISHELRTPLTGILGLSDLLLSSELDRGQRAELNNLKASAEMLLALLNNILDYSKFEAGHLNLECLDFNLLDVVEDVMGLLMSRAQSKDVSLKMTSKLEKEHLVFRSDPVRIRQVLMNFVANAIKFTHHGSVSIHISRNEADHLLRVEVMDSGIGIPADLGPKLFAPFTQADETTTRKFGGTGLGLAICKTIVEAMGGNIGYHSIEGQGATFWFTLDLQKGSSEKVSKKPKTADQSAIAGRFNYQRTINVLLAEDNVINRSVITTVLKRMGHVVTEAENGAIAVEKFRGGQFDIVLMDMQMPVMDGCTAFQEIRKLKTAGQEIPVIALTADIQAENNPRYLEAGLSNFITKPVDWQTLESKINDLLFND